MCQGATLNFGQQPVKRQQEVPGPNVAGNGVQVADHEARIAALESAVSALQAVVADHEARIAALEP